MMVSNAIQFLLIGACLAGAQRDLSQFTPLGQTRPSNPDFQPLVGNHQHTKPAVRPNRHQRSADPNSPTPSSGHQTKPQTFPGQVGVAVNPLPAAGFVKPAVLPASLPERHQRSADPNSPTAPPGHQTKPQTLPGQVGVAAKPLPAAGFVKPAVLPASLPERHWRSADPNSPTPSPGHQTKPQTLPGQVGVAVNPLPVAGFVKPAVLPASLPERHRRSADPNSPTPPPGHQTKPQTLPGQVGVAAKPLPAGFIKPAVLPASLSERHQRSADPNSPTPPPGHQTKPQTLPGQVGVAVNPLPAGFVKPVVLPASLPGRHQRSADPNSPTPPSGYQPNPQTLPGSVGIAVNPLPADFVQPALLPADLDNIELALDDTASLEYSAEDFSDSHKLSPIIGIVLPSGISKPTIGVTVKPTGIAGIGIIKPIIVTTTVSPG